MWYIAVAVAMLFVALHLELNRSLAGDMREIWLLQPRFEKRVGSAPFGLVEQPRFRAAFDFMRLRAENAELDMVLSDWWEAFSMADDNLRNDMVDEVKLEQQQQRAKSVRAPRVHKVPLKTEPSRDAVAPGHAPEPAAQLAETAEGHVKHRRRRRSKMKRADGDAPAPDSQE